MRRGLAVALLLASATASAQDDREQRARELYERGAKEYAEKNYEQAVESFKSSYAISARGHLLYNIALAYEEWVGHCEPAKSFYRQYLEKKPDAKDRDDVTARIQRLDTLCPDPAPPPPPVSTPTPTPAPALVEVKSLNVASLIVLASGVVVAGVGGFMVGAAGAKFGSLQSECPCPPSTWESWRTINYLGDALLVAGGAAALAGLVWFAIVPKRAHLVPSVGGVLVRGTF